MAEWKRVNNEAPPEGILLDTKIDDESGLRNEQPMVFRNNLWWINDESMYVYYRPTHWKAVPSA